MTTAKTKRETRGKERQAKDIGELQRVNHKLPPEKSRPCLERRRVVLIEPVNRLDHYLDTRAQDSRRPG